MGQLKLASASIAMLLLASPVLATDLPKSMPVKAPVAAPLTWNGWYAGVSLGARWADVEGTTISFGGLPPPLPLLVHQSYDSSTFRAGGYLGYNWQFNPKWLVGLEGDFAWGNGSKHVNALQGISVVGSFSEFKHTWDAGIRARVGHLFSPTWLLYTTGGLQWQHLEATVNCGVPACGGNAYYQSNSTTRTGWTIGGGLETMYSGNWLARVEYRYADYGTWRTTFGSVPAVVIVKDFNVATHTAFVGIARKF